MNYKVVQDYEGGSHLVGHLNVDYNTLVEKFGQPELVGPGYKIDAEWIIEFEDGTIATLYNWKNGPNYGGLPVEKITYWNVGGQDNIAFTHMEEIFKD